MRAIVATVCIAAAAALGFARQSTASTRPAVLYMTPKAAGAVLKASSTMIVSPFAVGNGTLLADGLVSADPSQQGAFFRGPHAQTASCRGFGARHKAGFAAFRCEVQWSNPTDGSHTLFRASIWMRPLPWTASPRWTARNMLLCASTRTLADCPPPLPAHPLPTDPRLCPGGCSPEQSVGNLAAAAKAATEKTLAAQGQLTVEDLGCVASTSFVYRCTWGDTANSAPPAGVTTVRFVRGKTAWTTTVTVSP